jgi:hypothetical protein
MQIMSSFTLFRKNDLQKSPLVCTMHCHLFAAVMFTAKVKKKGQFSENDSLCDGCLRGQRLAHNMR